VTRFGRIRAHVRKSGRRAPTEVTQGHGPANAAESSATPRLIDYLESSAVLTVRISERRLSRFARGTAGQTSSFANRRTRCLVCPIPASGYRNMEGRMMFLSGSVPGVMEHAPPVRSRSRWSIAVFGEPVA
jgi:hypothetical protein